MSVRVRYLAGMGRPKGPPIQPGDVRDVDSDEAERLIERGLAVPAKKGESLKSAADEHEKAMAERRGGRSRKTSTKTSKKAADAEKATT